MNILVEFFSHEITQALYVSGLKDDRVLWKKSIRTAGSERDVFWQGHLNYKVMSARGRQKDMYGIIYKVAERLGTAIGDVGSSALRKHVHALCYQPWHISHCESWLSTDNISPEDPKYLLQAALLSRNLDLVESLLNGPHKDALLSPRYDSPYDLEPWPGAISLAAELGLTDVLEKAFAPTFSNRREKRQEALGGAIRGGHLHVVEFIMDPRWGPIDFFDSSYCVDDNLMSGVLRSPLPDFSSQLYTMLRSRSTSRHPLYCWEPTNERSLYDVVASSPQRPDVAKWLLDSVGFSSTPKGKSVYMFKGALHDAIVGGNEQIVRLLLERSTDATIPDGVNLMDAVSIGRLDIVRVLVEHGATIGARNPDATYAVSMREPRYALDLAISTENEQLCRYLLAHGAECDNQAVEKAITAGLESMVRLLLEYGVKVTLEMVDSAQKLGHAHIAQLLQSHSHHEKLAIAEKNSHLDDIRIPHLIAVPTLYRSRPAPTRL